MKVLSVAFILMFASASGVALAGEGQPVDATATRTSASYSAYSDQSAESEWIRCACVVPPTFA